MGQPIIRSSYNFARLHNSLVETTKANGYVTSTRQKNSQKLSSSLSGFTNPAYRQQLQSFEQAGTPLEAWTDSMTNAYCAATWVVKYLNPAFMDTNRTIQYRVEGDFPTQTFTKSDDTTVASINVSSSNNYALANLNSAVADLHTSFQGGTFIAELRETLRMLTSPAKSFRTSLDGYLNQVRKHPKRMKIPHIHDMLSDTWLEYSFGVKPLLNDVNDAIAHFNTLGKANIFPGYTIKGKGTDETVLSSAPQRVGSGFPYIAGTRYVTSRSRVSYTAGYRMADNMSTFAKFQKLGVSPVDWIPTIWEIIPYSFLVDYFTNIGDIVQSVANVTSTPRWIIKTTTRTIERKTVFDGAIPWNDSNHALYASRGTVAYVRRGHMVHSRKYVVRELYDGRSIIPSLEFEIPGKSLKWVNMAALLSNMHSTRTKLLIR